MRRAVIVLLLVAAIGAGAGAYYMRRGNGEVQVNTSPVTRGDIVDTVGSTGTLQAVTTVQVGSQVSGNISWLGADFNSIVRKGQVIARIDPSIFQAQVEQARANLARAQADVERNRVALADAETKYTRASELAARSLLPQSELDAAKVAVDAARAQLQSSQASVVQAQASLSQSEVNLNHTVITAPIDGIVIQRSVDVGQTVAASLQSPTLFVIAADLTKMQVNANIDEADVGRIRTGQRVTFSVDAYPGETFSGNVAQIRLQPIVVQNVTTYGTIINVPNDELKLKPGMTANLRVQIASRRDVLRVPNAALRYRPSNDVFAALHQAVPADGQGTAGGGGGGRGNGDGSHFRLDRPQAAQGASTAGNGARIDSRPLFRADGPPKDPRPLFGARENARTPVATPKYGAPQSAETIDALFPPLSPVESNGRVWLYIDKQLKPVRVRLGITDGNNTELLSTELQPDMEVVTGVVLPGARVATPAGGTGNPLMPGRGGFGGPGRGR